MAMQKTHFILKRQMKIKKKILLYSRLKDLNLFNTLNFYKADLDALNLISDDIHCSNSLLEIIKKKPDVTLSYFYSFSLFSVIVTKLIGGLALVTGGGDQIEKTVNKSRKFFIYKSFAFIILLLSDYIILSSTADIKNFRKLSLGLRFLQKKIKYSTHPVDIIKPVISEFPFIKKSEFTILTICWMGTSNNIYRKGLLKCISILTKMIDLNINAKLIIVGPIGEATKIVEDYARLNDVYERIWITGSVDEIKKYQLINACSAYFQISTYEGFGLAAAEAFLSNKLVVHSSKGGLRDIFGKEGIIIEDKHHNDYTKSDVLKLWQKILKFEDYNYKPNNILYSIKKRAMTFEGIIKKI